MYRLTMQDALQGADSFCIKSSKWLAKTAFLAQEMCWNSTYSFHTKWSPLRIASPDSVALSDRKITWHQLDHSKRDQSIQASMHTCSPNSCLIKSDSVRPPNIRHTPCHPCQHCTFGPPCKTMWKMLSRAKPCHIPVCAAQCLVHPLQNRRVNKTLTNWKCRCDEF